MAGILVVLGALAVGIGVSQKAIVLAPSPRLVGTSGMWWLAITLAVLGAALALGCQLVCSAVRRAHQAVSAADRLAAEFGGTVREGFFGRSPVCVFAVEGRDLALDWYRVSGEETYTDYTRLRGLIASSTSLAVLCWSSGSDLPSWAAGMLRLVGLPRMKVATGDPVFDAHVECSGNPAEAVHAALGSAALRRWLVRPACSPVRWLKVGLSPSGGPLAGCLSASGTRRNALEVSLEIEVHTTDAAQIRPMIELLPGVLRRLQEAGFAEPAATGSSR
ncbi:MAG: hypothetical protein FJX75_07930 [Armatimonadetes bacterium]|nr:hypothetical protein [Armatimonadota bacterium]